MRSLFYIIRKSVKNGLKEIRKKPGKVIGYLIVSAFIILPLILSSKDQVIKTSVLNPDIYGSIAAGLILLFTVPELLFSLNSGATFFRGADINLVFTSPFSPQQVLIYGFIKQIYNSFIAVFFILFQAPQLYRFSNIKPYAVLIAFIGFFSLLLVNSVIKMLLYSLSSKSEKNKAIIKNIINALLILAVVFYFYNLYIFKSPGKALVFILNHKVFSYLPVYGWTKEILMAGLNGVSSITVVYILLLTVFAAICVYIIYSLQLDYYEDVLASTELKETAITATRKGEKVFLNTGKKAKVRKADYKIKGRLASAIFWRHVLEYKKTGFGFINFASLFYVVVAISAGFFLPIKDLRIIIGFMIYLQIIFTFASKWNQELSNPYVFIIPDSSFKKVLYSTAVDHIKNLVDGSMVFVIAGILFKSNLLLIVLNIIAFVSIGALFVYGGVLSRRVFGKGSSIILTSLFRLGLLMLIVAPGLVIFAVLNLINDTLIGQITAYTVFTAYNLLFSSLIIFLGKGIFENIELG